MWRQGESRVFSVRDVNLRTSGESWPFALRHASEIDAHWERRLRETPNFFNGVVHVLADYSVSQDGLLSGRLVRTDFKSFLYWRETGWPDTNVMDAFGLALILSADDRILLGRQRDGNLNSGLCYPPSGFIDPHDIGADGAVDIDRGVAREIREETGLGPPLLRRLGGYLVTIAGPVLSVAVPYRWTLRDEDLVREVESHIAADPKSELQSIELISPGANSDLSMPDYARTLLSGLPSLKTLA